MIRPDLRIPPESPLWWRLWSGACLGVVFGVLFAALVRVLA